MLLSRGMYFGTASHSSNCAKLFQARQDSGILTKEAEAAQCTAGRLDHCVCQLRAHCKPSGQVSAQDAYTHSGGAPPQELCPQVGAAGPLPGSPVSHHARSSPCPALLCPAPFLLSQAPHLCLKAHFLKQNYWHQPLCSCVLEAVHLLALGVSS